MKIIFLGTNGWYDTQTGNTTCVLVETSSEYIVFDAGSGLYKLDKFIQDKKPIYLFLSHFHLDHIFGLHALNKFNFRQGINIFGPPGLKRYIKTIISQPFTMPLKDLRTKVRLIELNSAKSLPINISFLKLKHSSLCYGYRLAVQDKVLVYLTDTGLCNNLFKLARNADILIAESSLDPGESSKWPHLNPEDAAMIAKQAKAKKLVLVHFDSSIYGTVKKRRQAGIKARKIFRNTIVSYDDMKIYF